MKISIAIFFAILLIITGIFLYLKSKKDAEIFARNKLIKEEAEKVLGVKPDKKNTGSLSMKDLDYADTPEQQDEEPVLYQEDNNIETQLVDKDNSLVTSKRDISDIVNSEEFQALKNSKKEPTSKPINNLNVPELAKKNNDQGVEAFKKREYDKSIAFYKDAIAIFPKYTLAHYNMGNSYYEMSLFDKAIDCYQKVIDIDSSDDFSYYNIAMSYYKKEDFKSAIEYYNKAILISPGDFSVHYNLGKVFEKMENYDEAIKAYQKSIDLNSDYANAHYNLAELYKLKGIYTKAVHFYDLYLKCNPNAEDNMSVKKLIMQLRSMS